MEECIFDPERLAVVTDTGRRVTYGELRETVEGLADAIRSYPGLGVVVCDNSFEALATYLAFLEAHVPVLLLDASKEPETYRAIFDAYRPSWICALVPATYEGCEMKIWHVRKTYDEPYEMNPDLAVLLTTSGSTGSPKLVRLTRENLRSNAEAIADYLDITADERPITSLPMHYSYGLSVINSHLLRGATLLMTDKSVMQREFWDFAREEGATSMAGVPYTYEMLRRLKVMEMDLPELKTFTQAGGHLRPELVREMVEGARAAGKRFMVMYGQTEATARMSYVPQEHALDKCGSIGVAIPGGRLEIVDGELVYHGPNVSMGYAECADDLLGGDDNHGTLYTGDLARMDEDGYFYITGRRKRFVKIWGNRCNLDSLEDIVREVTADCACTGVDDLVTVYVTAEGHEKEIRELLTERTGLNARAFQVKVVDAIPKSAAGKTLYSQLNN